MESYVERFHREQKEAQQKAQKKLERKQKKEEKKDGQTERGERYETERRKS